jgi:hypothetical protein
MVLLASEKGLSVLLMGLCSLWVQVLEWVGDSVSLLDQAGGSRSQGDSRVCTKQCAANSICT